MIKTKLETENVTETFYEAVIVKKGHSDPFETLTRNSLEDLQISINTYLKCGKYELKSADKVERVMVKLLAPVENVDNSFTADDIPF